MRKQNSKILVWEAVVGVGLGGVRVRGVRKWLRFEGGRQGRIQPQWWGVGC